MKGGYWRNSSACSHSAENLATQTSTRNTRAESPNTATKDTHNHTAQCHGATCCKMPRWSVFLCVCVCVCKWLGYSAALVQNRQESREFFAGYETRPNPQTRFQSLCQSARRSWRHAIMSVLRRHETRQWWRQSSHRELLQLGINRFVLYLHFWKKNQDPVIWDKQDNQYFTPTHRLSTHSYFKVSSKIKWAAYSTKKSIFGHTIEWALAWPLVQVTVMHCSAWFSDCAPLRVSYNYPDFHDFV